MRYLISISLAVLMAIGLSFDCKADESPAGTPNEWRVEVRVEDCPFERWTKHLSNRTIELRSTGEVIVTIEPFTYKPRSNDPIQTINKKVSPEATSAGLHLAWSSLEDMPLIGGVTSDGDHCYILIETKNWMWKRDWVSGSRTSQPADKALLAFEKLIHKNTIDPTSFRTRHLTPTEMSARWRMELSAGFRKEFRTPSTQIGWYCTSDQGGNSFMFSNFKFRNEKADSNSVKIDWKREFGSSDDIFVDVWDRCVDRETTGDKKVAFLFNSGGGDNRTSIQIKGFKAFSEAGPRIESLIRQVLD